MKFRNCTASNRRLPFLVLGIATCLFSLAAWTVPTQAQSLSSFDRERCRQMLDTLKADIKKNYYDKDFHGLDLDSHFKAAEEKLKTATSLGQALGIVAQTLLDFNDSHVFFLPPGRVAKVEYGWQMQMIGDKCFVSAVKPGSDAEAKGLSVGDQIYSIDGFEPSRETFWKLRYYYYSLRPKAGIRVVVLDTSGKQREVTAMAKVETGKLVKDVSGDRTGNDIFDEIRESENESRLRRNRLVSLGNELAIWKMPGFDQEPSKIDEIMGDVKKHKNLILDLRGNGGGYVVTMERLVGFLFDHDVKIADLKGRKEMKPMIGKTRGSGIYTGKIVVLIDSSSASAAEIFPRVLQIEKRGTVIGDRSAGAVMQALQYSHMSGVDIGAFYGASITNADVIMTDGKSIENVGVTPDELLLPTGADLKAQRDPVLARAAALLGVELTAEKAGSYFPIEFKK